MAYRFLYILAIFIGPFMTVEAVWTIADIFNALMALPNLDRTAGIKWCGSGRNQRLLDENPWR